jgi:hypothetical protein
MRSFIPLNRLLLAGIVAAAAALSLMQVAQAGPPPPVVPGAIQVPAGNKVFLVGHAVGVQIYSCNGTVWGFVAPRGNLYDDHGKLIITHFGGPTWQTKDGSTVVGHAEAMITVDHTAIPWVRLSAASTTPGRLGNTTYIQRIATTGGLAPRRGMQRDNGRHRGRGPIHRRLLLLEEDRCLTAATARVLRVVAGDPRFVAAVAADNPAALRAQIPGFFRNPTLDTDRVRAVTARGNARQRRRRPDRGQRDGDALGDRGPGRASATRASTRRSRAVRMGLLAGAPQRWRAGARSGIRLQRCGLDTSRRPMLVRSGHQISDGAGYCLARLSRPPC